MAKKRPMTNAEKVRKHLAEKAVKRQINLTLRRQTIAKLDRKAKQVDQTRSEFIDTLIESGNTTEPATTRHTQLPILQGFNTDELLAALHVLTCIDGPDLRQPARRSVRRSVTGNKKGNSVLKKKKSSSSTSTKRSSKKNVEVGDTTLDAIGLARPETFKDFPGAVSVSTEIKDISTIDEAGRKEMKWQSKPRKFMAVWEAQKHIVRFRKTNSDATINQRYQTEDKSIMDITAPYSDDRPDQRVVYLARNRN